MEIKKNKINILEELVQIEKNNQSLPQNSPNISVSSSNESPDWATILSEQLPSEEKK